MSRTEADVHFGPPRCCCPAQAVLTSPTSNDSAYIHQVSRVPRATTCRVLSRFFSSAAFHLSTTTPHAHDDSHHATIHAAPARPGSRPTSRHRPARTGGAVPHLPRRMGRTRLWAGEQGSRLPNRYVLHAAVRCWHPRSCCEGWRLARRAGASGSRPGVSDARVTGVSSRDKGA